MSLGVIVSSAALIISLMVTAVKFFDWLSHSEPRAIMRMGRLALVALAIASLPVLMTLLAMQQWTGAMFLGAAMLLGLVLVNWRKLAPRRRFRPRWTDDPGYGPPQRFGHDRPSSPDAELARRAAIVLQDYLALSGGQDGTPRRAGLDRFDDGEDPPGAGAMGAGEAMALLGLQPGASAAQIRAAHRRLMQLVHPDRGGTDYLAMKINHAKDVLLAEASRAAPVKAKRDAAPRAAGASRSRQAAGSRARRSDNTD